MKRWLSLLLTLLLMLMPLPATVADDTASEEEEEEIWALFLTNVLEAQDGLGTYRYTLALPSDDPLPEGTPRIAALGTLTRRLIMLDGSLGDPTDADILLDIDATKDLDGATGYALYITDHVLFLYENGELIINEELHKKYVEITITRNKRKNPAIRYTRKDGTTALVSLERDYVLLFSGEYEKLTFSDTLSKEPFAFGAGCYIEELTVNSDIILHNSGIVADSSYCPEGIWMVGIAIDEDGDPIQMDSGLWTTGPRPARGAWCYVCDSEIGRKEKEFHLVHTCEAPACQYGGLWASCATEGDMRPDVHAADPDCPFRWCALCSSEKCPFCQAERENADD